MQCKINYVKNKYCKYYKTNRIKINFMCKTNHVKINNMKTEI